MLLDLFVSLFFFQQLLDEKGVRSYFRTTVTEFVGVDGKLSQIVLNDGTKLSADLCIVGIGTLLLPRAFVTTVSVIHHLKWKSIHYVE